MIHNLFGFLLFNLAANPDYLQKEGDPGGGQEGVGSCIGLNGRTHQKNVQFFSSGPYALDVIVLSEPPKVKDRNVLHQKFIVEGLSSTELARQFGCSRSTVKKYLRLHNIRKGTPNGKTRHNLALGEKLVKGRVTSHKAELRAKGMIVDMHTKEGLPARAIARVLDTMKVPTKRQGKKWNHSVVVDILKREGAWKSSGEGRV